MSHEWKPNEQSPLTIHATADANRIHVRWSPVALAREYEVELRTADGRRCASLSANVNDNSTSFSRHLFNVPSDVPLMLRVRAIDHNGRGQWSMPQQTLLLPTQTSVAPELTAISSASTTASLDVPVSLSVDDPLPPAPLMQVYFQAGAVTMNYTAVTGATGYEAQLFAPSGQMAASQTVGVGILSMSFSAAQYNLQNGVTYTARVRGTAAGGTDGQWSMTQSVTVTELAVPVAIPTYAGGVLYGNVPQVIAGAEYYAFRATTLENGVSVIVDEAFAPFSALPVAFTATVTDGQMYSVTAQAVAGSALSAWSVDANITIAVLAAPTLTLGFVAPNIQATWAAVGTLTQYEFELWTTVTPIQRIAHQTLTQPPYAVNVSQGIVEDAVYRGQVRSQQGLNSSSWSVQQVQVSILDPLLQTLYASLTQAWHSGAGTELPMNATTLGTPGSAIVTLMQTWLGAPQIVLNSNIALTSDPLLDTVTATGSSRDPLLGIDAAAVTAIFRVSSGVLVADIAMAVGIGWDLSVSFPEFEQTIIADLSFDEDTNPNEPAFMLSSLGVAAATPYGPLPSGLSIYGGLEVQGPVAALQSLIPSAAAVLPVVGAISQISPNGAFDLVCSLPAVTLSSLPGLGSLAFTTPQLVVHAAALTQNPTYAVWVAADVLVGGLTLPLAVQLPIGSMGWAVLLRPGRSVPVSDLATFFGFVTGTSVGGILPSDIRALASLQIKQFRVAIDPGFTSFQSASVAIGSTSGNTNPLWSPLPGVLELTSLNLSIVIAKDATGTLKATGQINGSVLLGSTLQLSANILLPVGTGSWTFSAATSTSLASLDAFNALVGSGNSFASTLPAEFGGLGQYTLGALTLIVDPAGPTLTSVSFNLLSTAEWHVVGNAVVLTQLSTSLTLTTPMSSSRLLTGTIAGSLRVGSVPVDVLVTRPDAQSNWTLAIDLSPVTLPSLSDLAALVGGDGAVSLLPASLATNHFVLQDLQLVVDLSLRALQTFSFDLSTADTWTIIAPDILTATEARIGLSLDWRTGTRVANGHIEGTIGVSRASFVVTAVYANSIWTIDADMAPPVDAQIGTLDFSGALTQFGIGGSYVVPTNVGLPTLTLTSGHLHLVPSTGEFQLSVASALTWPLAFGTGTKALQITTLGASVHRLPNAGGWVVQLTGALAYDGISATVSVTLGSVGIDTVIDATVTNVLPAQIPQLADDLASTSASNKWSTIGFPSDFPALGLAQVRLLLNLTKSTLVLYGSTTTFGSGAFIIQKAPDASWQAAFGLNLSSNGQTWNFGQISQGLSAANSFFAINNASAALAISNVDGQALQPIINTVPELANAFPGAVRRGANFYGALTFEGAVVSNVPKVLGTTPEVTVTLYALIAAQSNESLFQVKLDGPFTLAGVVTFSNVFLQYQPKASPALLLHGDIAVTVNAHVYAFTGDLALLQESAALTVATTQSIVAPLGMTGITINALAIAVNYTFPAAPPSTLSVTMSGTVQIGSVANLTGLLYLLNGTPIIAAISVTQFDITNLFTQCIGVSWPSTLVPLQLVSASIYYYKPINANDQSPIVFNGQTYAPGFNVAAHFLILGRAATVSIAVVNGQGVTATGTLDAPIDWGFVLFSGVTQQTGPSASLATYPTASFTLTAGFTLFSFYVGSIAFTIAKDATSGEMIGTVAFTRTLPVFGSRTLTVHWSQSRGYYFDNFPIDLPAQFEIPNINVGSGACIGKQILQALPIDTQYNFDSSFAIADASLQITIQGYFNLTSMKQEILRIDLQRLVISIPAPAGAPFSWGDLPAWIANTIIANSYALLQQVLNDPASMAKLLAIEGVKYGVSALIDALVCENAELWGEGVADAFIEAATSAFATEVIVDGVAYALGGLGVAIGAGGAVTVGGGSNPPPRPGTPGNLSINYTNDTLYLSWGSASNATSYAYRLNDGSGNLVAQRSNSSATSATVPRSQIVWGRAYVLTVVANNNGVLGATSTPLSYTIPTPASAAAQQAASGVQIENASTVLQQVFPSIDATAMATALQGAYNATDPAIWATRMAVALRNGSYAQSATDTALPIVFLGITHAQLAAAIQAAYSLNATQLASYLAQHSYPLAEAASILAGVISPRPSVAALVSLLYQAYPSTSAAAMIRALALAQYAPQETANAIVEAYPAETAAQMAIDLVAAYTAPAIAPSAVAVVLVGAYAALSPLQTAQALQGAFTQPALAPTQIATALVAAFVRAPIITATAVASVLSTVFNYPTGIDASGTAIALVGAFSSPAITVPGATAAVFGLTPTPTASAMAQALVAAFTTPAVTPTAVAQALVATYLHPAPISAHDVGAALIAAFVSPQPISISDVSTAIGAAFTNPAITVAQLVPVLATLFPTTSIENIARAVAVGITTALPGDAARALRISFPLSTPTAIASALAFGFSPLSAAGVASALRIAFDTPAITPAQVGSALVVAFATPTPLTPLTLVSALQSAFDLPPLTPNDAALSLVAGFTGTAALSPTQVAQCLTGSTFTPALTSTDVAKALVLAFVSPQPITPSEVTAALLSTYVQPPIAAIDVAQALVAAFVTPTPITSTVVAQTLHAAAFTPALTIAQVAVAVVGAFHGIDPEHVVSTLVATFTNPPLAVNDLATALVAAIVSPPITAATLASLCKGAFLSPPITPTEIATALVVALVNPPVTSSAVVAALQATFTGPPPITIGATASALVQAYPATAPVTPSDVANALVAGWTPAPSAAEVAVTLVALFVTPQPMTPQAVAATLLSAFGASATPSVIASALTSAFTTPTPISPQQVVQTLVDTPFQPAPTVAQLASALVDSFAHPTPITPIAVGLALRAVLGATLTPRVLAASLVPAFSTITLNERAQTLCGVFDTPVPITADTVADALICAVPASTPTQVLQALISAPLHTPVDPNIGAASLVFAFQLPSPITPSQVAEALVGAFTAPPVTENQVAIALCAAFANVSITPSMVAIAIVFAFALPTPTTTTKVALALRAAFVTPTPIDPSAVAVALVASFTLPTPITATSTVAALQAAFGAPPLTAAQAAQSLVASFTQPDPISVSAVATTLVQQFVGLLPSDCLTALQAAFTATAMPVPVAAAALVTAYSSTAPTPTQILAALKIGYPTLTLNDAARALVVAFASTPLSPSEIATALVGSFPSATQSTVAIALVFAMTSPAITPSETSTALQAAYSTATVSSVATALVAAYSTPAPIAASSIAFTLVATFPAAAATMPNVAQALVAAIPSIAREEMATALVRAFIGTLPTALGHALLSVWPMDAAALAVLLLGALAGTQPAEMMTALHTLYPSDLLPDLAVALHTAYPATTAIALAPVLVAGWTGADATMLAIALQTAWQYTSSDIAALLTATVAGFANAAAPLDASMAAPALRSALHLTDADAQLLASAVATQFLLTRAPNDVAALTVAVRAAGVPIIPAAAALSAVYAPNWNGPAFGRLLSVYTVPQWDLAQTAKLRGDDIVAIAQDLKVQFPGTSADLMVLVIASTFYDTYTTTGVAPVGRAMKAAIYTLTDAAAAMGSFYAPFWTGADFGILLRIYNDQATPS